MSSAWVSILEIGRTVGHMLTRAGGMLSHLSWAMHHDTPCDALSMRYHMRMASRREWAGRSGRESVSKRIVALALRIVARDHGACVY